MASEMYNEVTYSLGAGGSTSDCSAIDPLYRYEHHFPDRITKLNLSGSGGGLSVGGVASDTFQPHLQVSCVHGSPTGGASAACNRRSRRARNRNSSRFKTQPITFDEIQEVDETETAAGGGQGGAGGGVSRSPTAGGVSSVTSAGQAAISGDDVASLKNQFSEFSRSMDRLAPVFASDRLRATRRAAAADCTTRDNAATSAAGAPEMASAGGSVSGLSTDSDQSKENIPANLPPLQKASLCRHGSAPRRKKRANRRVIDDIPETENRSAPGGDEANCKLSPSDQQ